MTSVLTFYHATRELTRDESVQLSRCIAGFVNARYEIRDKLLEDGTLDIIEIETEDDEDKVIQIFEHSGYKLWDFGEM